MRKITDTIQEIDLLLDELRTRPNDCVILVEGRKDVDALRALGVEGRIRTVQGAHSLFSIAEDLAFHHDQAIILTDWDRKGGQLAMLLRNALKANEVRFNDSIRARLSQLSKKEIKDIESLPSFIALLNRRVEEIR